MEYVYKPGCRSSVSAQIVGERLEHLRAQHDEHVTPAVVVDDARPEDADLHPCFEWDNETAAERYREDQARSLIRSVYVVHTDDDGNEQPVLGYIHVDLPDDGPAYVTTARAVSDEELREQVERDALSAFQALQRRYAHIQGLGGVFQAIERAAAEMAAPKPKKRNRRKAEAIAQGA